MKNMTLVYLNKNKLESCAVHEVIADDEESDHYKSFKRFKITP